MRFSQLSLGRAVAGVAAIAVLLTVGLLAGGGNAEPQGPPGPPAGPVPKTKAGIASFPAGEAGININFPFGFKIVGANYAVVVQPTNTAGYSPVSECTYFNPLHKRDDGFEVQHKTCLDGTPEALDVGVSLNWIVVEIK